MAQKLSEHVVCILNSGESNREGLLSEAHERIAFFFVIRPIHTPHTSFPSFLTLERWLQEKTGRGIYTAFHSRIIAEFTKFHFIYLFLSTTDINDMSTVKPMLTINVSYINTGRILMTFTLLWRKFEGFGYCYASFIVLGDVILSPFECINNRDFLLQPFCHLIWV